MDPMTAVLMLRMALRHATMKYQRALYVICKKLSKFPGLCSMLHMRGSGQCTQRSNATVAQHYINIAFLFFCKFIFSFTILNLITLFFRMVCIQR